MPDIPYDNAELPNLNTSMAGPSLEGLLNADMLKWAREQSSLDVEEAARRANVKPEQLRAWEEGPKTPTLTQLRKIANAYKRSVSVFFLRERPVPIRMPRDFRRLELSAAGTVSPELTLAIREAHAKRESALDIFAQMEDTPPTFELRLAPNIAPEDAGAYFVRVLEMPLERRAQWNNHYDALNAWRRAVEANGVLVMQASGIETSEMRGCSVSLSPLPIIILNSSDSPLGRLFTLLHELAHLSGRTSGMCDLSERHKLSQDDANIEKFCNHVAGAALVPRDDLLRQPAVARAARNAEWSDDQLGELKKRYWASPETVLRRLQIVGKTTAEFYQRRREQFLREYAANAPDRNVNVPHHRKVIGRNGRFLTGLVLEAYHSNVITGSELSRVLGAKLDHLPRIEAEMRGAGGA
jgi:Zn-dependent peptidase ImmA (M78 family)/DNA-binding XRE family transcriptional regulator